MRKYQTLKKRKAPMNPPRLRRRSGTPNPFMNTIVYKKELFVHRIKEQILNKTTYCAL